MMEFLKHIGWFAALILLQVLLLDNVHFLGAFIPVIYIFALMRLPANLPKGLVVVLGFALGLTVDVLSDTPGLHASATTLIAFLRYPFLRLFVTKEDLGNRNVGEDSIGTGAFWKYAVLMVLIHHITLFLLEAFSLAGWWFLLLKILVCSILTLIFLFAMERINQKKDART